MNCYRIIFSPTGGTEKVACYLTDSWDNVKTVDLSDRNFNASEVSIKKEDMVLVAMPSFGGLAPELALKRFLKIKGNGARCAIVAVYGNRDFEDTLAEMEDAAVKCGFKVIAGVSAIAEHSITREIAAGRPDESDRKELIDFGKKIMEKEGHKVSIPGNRPYKEAGGSKIVPFATEDCISCDICASKCPTGAINLINPHKVEEDLCISCMRCVSVCPHNARKIDEKVEKHIYDFLSGNCAEPKKNKLYI